MNQTNLNDWWKITKKTYTNWMANEPFQMSAAVSYYALFSFPALIIIVIQTAGAFYNKATVKGKILTEIKQILGPDSAETVETLIKNAMIEDQSNIALLIGIGTLLYGATGLFISLQKALNTIWGIKLKPSTGIFKMIRDRVFSLGLIIAIGFLLLVSLVLTTIISTFSDWLTLNMSEVFIVFIHAANFLLSLALVTVLFALIYKVLPDAKISWRSVWLGAFVTSLFFTIGKSALGVYFSTMNPGSSFGAASSIVLILLWVSYSCLILFFGAEFTKVYASSFGKGVTPTFYAEKIDS